MGTQNKIPNITDLDVQQVYCRLQEIQQEIALLSDFVASKIRIENEVKQKSWEMIDPRSGLPFGQRK
jgi:hypothetical protein